MDEIGLQIVSELPVAELATLPRLPIREGGCEKTLVVAAGGDGTVGAVADRLADTDGVLGVLPLGTSNDFARSLKIPMRIDRAVRLLKEGTVSTVDLGRVVVTGRPPAHFVHAATAGLNVNFARLATRASVRRRFGRLTYVVAALSALEERRAFDCRLIYGDQTVDLRLAHLSVINAPVFGGLLGMRVGGVKLGDRLLDVIAVEELPAWRVAQAALYQLLGVRRPLRGFHTLRASSFDVQTEEPLDVALDGEVVARLPATFAVASEALRVVTPRGVSDTDD